MVSMVLVVSFLLAVVLKVPVKVLLSLFVIGLVSFFLVVDGFDLIVPLLIENSLDVVVYLFVCALRPSEIE